MHELDDGQWNQLRQLHKLASVADMETDAALYSGTLDDAKAAIQAVVATAEALSLPDGLCEELQGLARQAWQAADGTGDVKSRALDAMGAVDQIEQMIEAQFAAARRKL